MHELWGIGMRVDNEQTYLDLLADVMANGEKRGDRTGVGTLSVFGRQARYSIQPFPAVTTKRLFFRGVKEELLWMLAGGTNVRPLQERGVHIWDHWADEDGELGPVYGAQWRKWPGPVPEEGFYDQVSALVHSIQESPESRRHMLSAWNVSDLWLMRLAPCHVLAQFHVRQGRFLDCQMYQRSADLFLGVPFNIAQYALLTSMLAQVTGYEPGDLIHTMGDAHIYLNHLTQVDEQLSRTPCTPPELWLAPEVTRIDDYTVNDIWLQDYECWPKIEAPVAV